MPSPAIALLWEIWRRQRELCLALVAVTVVGRTLQAIDSAMPAGLLRLLSFVLVFGIFNYTEPTRGRGLGSFPSRLFVLPISSLRLVAIPLSAGVISVVLLYLVWIDPRATGGFGAVVFNSVLLATVMICYQAALWTLHGLGPIRLVVVGMLIVAAFLVFMLFATASPLAPWWRTGTGLTAATALVAVLVFVATWRYIAWVRSGASHGALAIGRFVTAATNLLPVRRTPFRSPATAHFWFEWQAGGFILPLLVGGIILLIVAPLTWQWRGDAVATQNLLVALIGAPPLLAIAVGIGFAQPVFWSEDLSLPAFIATKPLSDERLVATKVKVAFASALVSWLLVLGFAALWLPLWGNLDALRTTALRLWTMYDRSYAVVFGLCALIALAGMLLTWRFLIIRLWTGLSGRRGLHSRSVGAFAIFGLAALILDVPRLAGLALEKPAYVAALMWGLAIAVLLKFALAAHTWQHVARAYRRQYCVAWMAGALCFGMTGWLLWRVARDLVSPALASFGIPIVLLGALLLMPAGRLGLARVLVTRNRHR